MIKLFPHSARTIILALLSFALCWLATPSLAHAKVGTHLGYGDISHQLNLLDILKQNGAEDGFPVTIMTSVGTSENDLEKLAAKLASYGFFAIVRIDNTCSAHSPQETINKFHSIFSKHLANNFILTYGNEVNNRERECSDWSLYAQNYKQIHASFLNLSPAALDWYNSEFPANDFLQATNLAGQYQAAPVRTANAYGCIGDSADSCDPLNTNTHQVGMSDYASDTKIPSSKLYLTEFSLSPGGKPSPDSDLNKVIQFIENRAAETGAVHITPLIRNVCSNISGDWLLYVHGKILAPDGTEVDPNNCETTKDSKKSGAKSLNDYITYPLIANPDKYADEESGVIKYMKNLILEQGYEVHCAHPNLVITHEAIGNFQEYFEQTGRDMVTFDNRDSEKINMNQAKIPLYRGSEASEATLKTSSFEGFLGVINPNPSEEQKQNTAANSGVANNLLNRSQQCIIKLKNLETAKQVCESLEQPEACTFHEQIANSDYYLYSTPAQEALEPSLLTKIKSSGLDCQDLSLPWSQELGIEQEEFEKISQAISNTPLDLDKLYRYAFVILSPEHDLDDAQMKGSCGVKDPADRFWFLSFDPNHSSCHGEGHIYLPKHNPLFVAIKIPVTLTNEVKNYSYQDSGNITADILTTTEVQQQIDQKADEKRSKLFDASMAAKEIHDHGTEEEKLGLIINCSGMPRCEGAHGAGVDLLKALVHIVNGSHKVCSDFDQQVTQDPYAILNEQDNPNPIGALEQVEEIGTPAKYSAAAQRQFKLEYNEINFESAKSQSWDWMLKIKKGDNPNDPTVQEKVGIHIVAPLGADIEYLQSRFASFFTEDALAKTIADNTLPASENRTGIVAKYLPINFAELGFQSSATRNYSHPDCPCQRDELGYCKIDAYGNEIKTDCKQVKVKLDDHNVGLYLARGGRLAFMIREVIQSITSTTSKAYAYVASCKNLEDLFTGRCSGEIELNYGPPDGLPYNGSLGSGSCEPITNEDSRDNPCHVNNLKSSLEAYIRNSEGLNEDEPLPISEQELNKRATQASIICNAESGGDPNALNDGCLTGKSVDYSVGLFQINLLAHHCPEYFSYSWEPPQCEITSSELAVTQCASEVLQPEVNLQEAWRISGAGSNWQAWSTAKEEYCGPSLRSVE
jgi:hypothetical protein